MNPPKNPIVWLARRGWFYKLDRLDNKAIDAAKKISIKLKNDFNDKISLKRKEFENILNSETLKAEQEIHNFKKQTLENIQNIAGDFSKELIEKITGVAPNGSNLNAVILEISNKEKIH